MNDTGARLVEDVIKLTATDANTGVRRTGKIIYEAYKSFIPDNVERLVLNVSIDDNVSHIPSCFISSLSQATKMHLMMQVAAVLRSASRILSAVIPRRPFMLRISLLEKCQADPPILSALSTHEMYAR